MSTPSTDPVLEITSSILTEAAKRPWLAALLMRRRPDWLTRLVLVAQHMRNLPRHTRRALRRKLASGLAAAALLLALAGTPTAYAGGVVGTGTAGSCTDGALNAALSGGGTVTFNCGASPVTITVASTKSFASGSTTIDGGGLVTLSGNNTRQVINVSGGASLTLKNITISGGNATGGGGIQNAGTLTIQNSTISGNHASTNGGGIFNTGGTVTVTNSTLSGNSANYGGAFYGDNLVMTNSTVSGNTVAKYGGGIASAAITTITNSTITNNTANSQNGGGSGGGGITLTKNTSVLTLIRTIVSGNTAPIATSGREVDNYYGGTINANSLNLFGNSSEDNSQAFYNFAPSGSDITATSNGTNPTALASILNSTLENNGSQPHPFTHALVLNSPAVDKIAKATCDAGPINGIDERGAARAAGTNKGGANCDIGAFEYASTLSPTALTLQGLTATANSSPGIIGPVGAMIAALGALVIGRRRLKARAVPRLAGRA